MEDMTVFVKTNTGFIITVHVEAVVSTVDDVKAKVKEVLGIPPREQRLLTYAGEKLKDSRLLSDYNLVCPWISLDLLAHLGSSMPLPMLQVHFDWIGDGGRTLCCDGDWAYCQRCGLVIECFIRLIPPEVVAARQPPMCFDTGPDGMVAFQNVE